MGASRSTGGIAAYPGGSPSSSNGGQLPQYGGYNVPKNAAQGFYAQQAAASTPSRVGIAPVQRPGGSSSNSSTPQRSPAAGPPQAGYPAYNVPNNAANQMHAMAAGGGAAAAAAAGARRPGMR